MKHKLVLACNLLVIFVVGASISLYAQSAGKASFTVDGEVLNPLKLTSEDFTKLNLIELKAKGHDGKEHVYKGVRLFDVLNSAGVSLGSKLRGKNLSKYVVVKAADGYEVIFSLPEIDPEFTSQTILIAFQEDGNSLPKGDGPFRMVVPNDKKHARWIREVTAIVVMVSK